MIGGARHLPERFRQGYLHLEDACAWNESRLLVAVAADRPPDRGAVGSSRPRGTFDLGAFDL